MPPRLPAITSAADGLTAVNKRLDSIEDALTDRLLPPGYKINTVGGDIVITRRVDGSTSTLVFA